MASSAPHSPARQPGRDNDAASPLRPSPSKFLRLDRLTPERASSVPARRLSPGKPPPKIRTRLNQYYSFDHAVSLLKKCKNVIVLTGAGISTSLGVPDFRSKHGVYNLIDDSVYDDPQDLFHIDNFKTDPEEFFKQAKKLFPLMQGLVPTNTGVELRKAADGPMIAKYGPTHAFLALLQDKGKLLTNYTQNIDSLEIAAGVSTSRLVQCHGTLSTATCMSCGKRTSAKKYMPAVMAGQVPFCKCSDVPQLKKKVRRGRPGRKKRKRDEFEDSDSDGESAEAPRGLYKPDIVFFGESISNAYAPRLAVDKHKADLLVIIGTSMKVAPVSEMPFSLPSSVPQIWVSKERCQRDGVKVDIELLGECDVVIEELCRRAGWSEQLEDRLWKSGGRTAPRSNVDVADKSATTSKRPLDSPGPPRKVPVEVPPIDTSKPSQKTVLSPVKDTVLELRSKSDPPTPSLEVKPLVDIKIKVNDEEVDSGTVTPKVADVDTGADASATATKDPRAGTASVAVVLSESVAKLAPEGEMLHEHVGLRASELPPSNVTIELEEGTRSRWYVRRKMSAASVASISSVKSIGSVRSRLSNLSR